jgi:hypothetical protein
MATAIDQVQNSIFEPELNETDMLGPVLLPSVVVSVRSSWKRSHGENGKPSEISVRWPFEISKDRHLGMNSVAKQMIAAKMHILRRFTLAFIGHLSRILSRLPSF